MQFESIQFDSGTAALVLHIKMVETLKRTNHLRESCVPLWIGRCYLKPKIQATHVSESSHKLLAAFTPPSEGQNDQSS